MPKIVKGFTLMEVLVVILVSTLVLAMVGGTMVFITTSAGELMQESEEIDTAKNIEKYVRAQVKEENDAVNIENKVIETFLESGLLIIDIKEENGFLICYIEFSSGKNYEFIIDVV